MIPFLIGVNVGWAGGYWLYRLLIARQWNTNIDSCPIKTWVDVKYGRSDNAFVIVKAIRNDYGWKAWCGCNICEEDILAWRKRS